MFSQFDDEEIEIYFNRLNAQLKKMPPDERAELFQELRQHIDALATAHEEPGTGLSEAAGVALRQFGDPKRIGRKMLREWWLTRYGHMLPALGPILCASALLFSITMGCCYLPGHRGDPEWYGDLVCYGVPPLFAGSIIGLWLPRQALRASVYSALLIMGWGIIGQIAQAAPFFWRLYVDPFYPIPGHPISYPAMTVLIDRANIDACTHEVFKNCALPVLAGFSAYALSALRRGGLYRVRATDFKLSARHQ